jgi:2-(1,2-epoxy-1,2-dihydrophenyl)acetyl-CoA isomerase
MAKKCINEGMDKDFSEVIRLERESQMRLFNTRDFKEGVRAFLEKKTAEFKGK